jgi:uncharacterized paraquat-inducible protein A
MHVKGRRDIEAAMIDVGHAPRVARVISVRAMLYGFTLLPLFLLAQMPFVAVIVYVPMSKSLRMGVSMALVLLFWLTVGRWLSRAVEREAWHAAYRASARRGIPLCGSCGYRIDVDSMDRCPECGTGIRRAR